MGRRDNRTSREVRDDRLQVDAAKALLLQQRLQLEAGSERWGNGDGVPVRRADVGGKPGVLDGPCAPGP